MKYNPTTKNGLKLNQRLTIPNAIARIQTDETSTSVEVMQQEIPKPSEVARSKFNISFSDDVISHVVLPQESLYTLSKRFMVPVPELQALNHLSSSRVSPGQTVRIPLKKEKVERVQIRPVPPKKVEEKTDELQFSARKSFEIALFLPLNLDSTASYNRFVSSAALEYYMGAKLAIDSLTHLGLNAVFHVYDYESATENLTAILAKPELLNMDIIFAPLQQREAEVVSAFARKNELTVAFPVAMKESELIGNPNAICLSPSSTNLMDQLALSVHHHFVNQTVVLIKGESEVDMRMDQLFLTAFRNVPSSVSKAKIIEATWKNYKQYEFMNEDIIYVVLSTDKAKVLSLLEKYKSNEHVHIYGLKEWLEWKEISGTITNTYAFTYASPSYFSYHSPSVMTLHKKYRKVYMSDLTKMACLGFDATLMVCRQLISQTNQQTGILSNYQLLQQGVGNGFQNTAGYILDFKGFESKPE
jgi:LysM repeat protein